MAALEKDGKRKREGKKRTKRGERRNGKVRICYVNDS